MSRPGHAQSGRPLKDLTGLEVGRLTVIERIGRDADGCMWWRCQCACGEKTRVRHHALACKQIFSCGCLKSEATKQWHARRSGKDAVADG